MAISLQRSAFLEAIQKHEPSATAVVENDSGSSFSYSSLLQGVACAKELLLRKTARTERDISGERIAFMVENGFDYTGMDETIIRSRRRDPCQTFLFLTNPNRQ